VTSPTGDDTAHTFTTTPCAPYEISAKYYQGSYSSGALLKTVTTDYNSNSFGNGTPLGPPLLNIFPIRTTTTWPNGKVTKVERDYDSGPNGTYGNVIAQREYDYGNGSPGPLLRTTTTSYYYASHSTYLTNNLIALPASVQVTDAGGTQRAYTTYGYDERSLQPSGIGASQQHDLTPIDGTQRGNLTSVHRWLNGSVTATTNCNISVSNGYLVSYKTYYDTGTVYQSTDSCGSSAGDLKHTTTYAYSSTYWGAYPTTITNPLSQSTINTYDFNTGLLASTQDPNNQTTSFTYDNMWRLATVTYPDGGSTTVTHQETTFPFTATLTKTITPSPPPPNYTRLNIFDGLGRMSETVLTSDPSGYDYTPTTYDALGRPYQVYNATRCSPPTTNCGTPTWGYTAFTYDALSRVTRVTRPDGTSVQTSYNGRATQVSDEGNGTKSVARISQVDGLGRLASVCEVSSTALTNGSGGSPTSCGQDISATGFLTTYQYDVLDNLIQVNQGSLNPRKFVYDSLSRLTSSTNPEANTVPGTTTVVPTTYSYDADGNVIQRIAPAPNQQGTATVTTTYTPDVLNRLTSRSYNDGRTPVGDYFYDQCSACSGTITNGIGRLVHESNQVNAASTYAYDPMGRIVQRSGCIPLNCNDAANVIITTHDYLGDITSVTNSLGVTLSYKYNAAAELTTVTSSLNDSSHPGPLFSGPYYNETALTSVTLGNGLNETRAYDDRLRPVSVTDGSVYSVGTGYGPDGDVLAANDSTNGNWTYTYDDFNRLLSATNSAKNLAYTYGYDRYGNRWQQYLRDACTAGTSFCITFDNNNRVNNGSLVYDTPGNVIQDSMHRYYYDADNNLIQVDGPLGTCSTACYTYFPDGKRVEKNTAGVRLDYLYDTEGHEITEVNSSLGWNRTEVYAGDRHLATYSGGATGTTYFTHADWLGTERARTTVTGSLCETVISLAFGDGMSTSGSCGDPTPMHFTGKERDNESGLDNFGKRYHASTMGRFMTPDPVKITPGRMANPQQLNLYSYVANNPLRFVDPDGETLQISGNVDEAQKQLCVLIGGDCSRISYNGDTHTITVNLTGIDLSQNEGASLLNDVVGSKNDYSLDLGSSMLTAGGLRSITNDDPINLDNRPDWRYGKGKSAKDLPPAGVDDAIGIDPNSRQFRDSKGNVVPLSSTIFHELAEAFAKVDGGQQYVNRDGSPGAHDAAVQRELNLRAQRPNMKLEGRAGDQLIRDPKPPKP
jgi:RHS repeat-associated protein